MTQEEPTQALVLTPWIAVARRMKELRQRRGWTAAELADRCAEIGMPELNRSVIANIESHRRKYVTVDEAFTLAYALDVAPIHLLVPTTLDPDFESTIYGVAPDRFLPVAETRAWIRGDFSPGGIDPRIYHSEVPKEEFSPPRLSEEDIVQRGERLEAHQALVRRLLPKERDE